MSKFESVNGKIQEKALHAFAIESYSRNMRLLKVEEKESGVEYYFTTKTTEDVRIYKVEKDTLKRISFDIK